MPGQFPNWALRASRGDRILRLRRRAAREREDAQNALPSSPASELNSSSTAQVLPAVDTIDLADRQAQDAAENTALTLSLSQETTTAENFLQSLWESQAAMIAKTFPYNKPEKLRRAMHALSDEIGRAGHWGLRCTDAELVARWPAIREWIGHTTRRFERIRVVVKHLEWLWRVHEDDLRNGRLAVASDGVESGDEPEMDADDAEPPSRARELRAHVENLDLVLAGFADVLGCMEKKLGMLAKGETEGVMSQDEIMDGWMSRVCGESAAGKVWQD